MKYLGIDYGTRRIGLAASDESGSIAFPRQVIPTSPTAVKEILSYIQSEAVGAVVVGEWVNKDGEQNVVEGQVDTFVAELESLGVLVFREREWFSSHQAALQNFDQKSTLTTRPDRATRELLDAQAAAIILQRYLDKVNKVG